MKYCPQCDERYDEEIIRFCTKDGTPLIEEEQPKFSALPSENVEESDTDIGEQTVIRRRPENVPPPVPETRSERIVIPTSQPEPQVIRPSQTAAAYYPPPRSNTGKTVFLTILGTLLVLGLGAAIFWALQKEKPANANNINLNANQNVNLNANVGFDSNFNFNAPPPELEYFYSAPESESQHERANAHPNTQTQSKRDRVAGPNFYTVCNAVSKSDTATVADRDSAYRAATADPVESAREYGSVECSSQKEYADSVLLFTFAS